MAFMAPGSSPLARGLQAQFLTAGDVLGIIPARAGFTVMAPRTCTPSTDHPRSRGVYQMGTQSFPAIVGSSPLARGLRRRRRAHSWRSPDHPRSRGVYAVDGYGECAAHGSSPLARGLLQRLGGEGRRPRIIPARAGFTLIKNRVVVQPEDHPRSRGVYVSMVWLSVGRWGSSPLARGLQNTNVTGKHPVRIIPARAGFTTYEMANYGEVRDHPRSRGVYHRQHLAGRS